MFTTRTCALLGRQRGVVDQTDALPGTPGEPRADLALDRRRRALHLREVERQVLVASGIELRRAPRNTDHLPAVLEQLLCYRSADAGACSRNYCDPLSA